MSELLLEFNFGLDKASKKLQKIISERITSHSTIIVDGVGFFEITNMGDRVVIDCFMIVSNNFRKSVIDEINTLKEIMSINGYNGIDEDIIFLNLINGENSELDFEQEVDNNFGNSITFLRYSIELDSKINHVSIGHIILSGFYKIIKEHESQSYFFNFYNSFINNIGIKLDFLKENIINFYSNSSNNKIRESLYFLCNFKKIDQVKKTEEHGNLPF